MKCVALVAAQKPDRDRIGKILKVSDRGEKRAHLPLPHDVSGRQSLVPSILLVQVHSSTQSPPYFIHHQNIIDGFTFLVCEMMPGRVNLVTAAHVIEVCS